MLRCVVATALCRHAGQQSTGNASTSAFAQLRARQAARRLQREYYREQNLHKFSSPGSTIPATTLKLESKEGSAVSRRALMLG